MPIPTCFRFFIALVPPLVDRRFDAAVLCCPLSSSPLAPPEARTLYSTLTAATGGLAWPIGGFPESSSKGGMECGRPVSKAVGVNVAVWHEVVCLIYNHTHLYRENRMCRFTFDTSPAGATPSYFVYVYAPAHCTSLVRTTQIARGPKEPYQKITCRRIYHLTQRLPFVPNVITSLLDP